MAEYTVATTEGDFKVRGNVGAVNVTFGFQQPPPTEHDTESSETVFTRDVFEDALDKVSRPVKGKYAHVPYSNEDLIRDKRKEVELEDRQP